MSGFTDVNGEWNPCYSKWTTHFNKKLDYYVILNKRYKKGYSVAIYLSKHNSTSLKVDSERFDTQRDCKRWVEETINLIENCPDRFNKLCSRIYSTNRATVYKLEDGVEKPYFSVFHGHYMMGINKIAQTRDKVMYHNISRDSKWLVESSGGCTYATGYTEKTLDTNREVA